MEATSRVDCGVKHQFKQTNKQTNNVYDEGRDEVFDNYKNVL